MASSLNCRRGPNGTPVVWLQPLNCSKFLSTLRSFQSLLESCMGAKGGLKILVTAGGYLSVTTSSQRLVNNVEFDHPILLLILNVIRNQLKICNDCGLYTGVMISSLLQYALVDQESTSVKCNLLKNIGRKLVEKLEQDSSSSVCIKVSFTSIKSLVPVVKTVVKSKTSCHLLNEEVTYLSILILKAFVQTIPENKATAEFGHVVVLCQEGLDVGSSELFHGVLYRAPDIDPDDVWKWTPKFNNETSVQNKIKIILFDVMLTNVHDSVEAVDVVYEFSQEFSQYNAVTERVTALCQQLVLRGVSVFACQKVVHSKIKELFEKNGILVLERLGLDLTRSLARLSGAVPISSIVVQDIELYAGHLQSVRHIVRHGKSYVLLQQEKSIITTLLVHNLNEESAEELKRVTHQSLDTLSQLVLKPVLLPGGGCLEMWLITELGNEVLSTADELCKKYSCSKIKVISVLHWVQKSLFKICQQLVGSDSILITDSVFHHVWPLAKTPVLHPKWKDCITKSCSCGMIRKSSVEEKSGDWYEIVIERYNTDDNFRSSLSLNADLVTEDSVVDFYASKMNALKLAFETLQNVLNIGMIVSMNSK